jgi:uncharacterized protein YbjQ (UPF0145 family)
MGVSVYSFDPGLRTSFARYSRTINCPGDQVLNAARRKAMRAMELECRALGGDGIIAVNVEIGPFKGEQRTRAFQVRGTAVRARGTVRSPEPFSSHLDAQEFVTLIDAGWVPVRLLVAASMRWINDRRKVRSFAPNQEMKQWTTAFDVARTLAVSNARHEAAMVGADGVVMSEMAMQIYGVGHERYIEARFIGTAIAEFGSSSRPREWTQLEKLLPTLRTSPSPRPLAVPPIPIIRLSAYEP